MNWQGLYTTQRTGDKERKGTNPDPVRNSFLRDYDRIIFSSAFRRLQNKTQVFPLPGAIFVHNRLTHSLEVASVGRSLGKAVGEAIHRWDSDQRVAVIASGGLSHQLDGERAGFINKAFDLQFLESLQSNPEWATQFSSLDIVEKAGTQGVELLMWLAMRAALSSVASGVQKVHGNYHIPISNTATGVLALEPVG